MPRRRTLLAVPAFLALLSLVPAGSQAHVTPLSDAVLPLLVAEGGAPAAALLAHEGDGSRFAHAESTSAPSGATERYVGPAGAAVTETGPLPTGAPARSGSTRSGSTRGGNAAQAIRRADHFRAGSITKTFIATVVLQLAAEHRLSLSDTVEDHLPGLVRGAGNDGRTVTLRALLTHTSGLADYTADTGGTVPVTSPQAVHIALTHPPATPGRFSYSNTNYVLLGMVIQQVTGHTYATEAKRRLITPLRLTGTSFPGARSSLPDPHGRAYAANSSDVTELDPRVAGAAGELVTTLTNLNRFYAALLRGDLLPPRRLREMLNTRAAHGKYGMGLYPVRLPCGTTVWGHDGRISGSYVRTAATVDGRRVLTFRVNTDASADPGLEPALLTAEFCPRTS